MVSCPRRQETEEGDGEMSDRKARQKRLLRVVCILCALSILLAWLPACGGPESVSDDVVETAARAFARGLKAAGKTAAEVVEEVREEAAKWGPKAQLFFDIVMEELRE
jgi:hypothetical protein